MMDFERKTLGRLIKPIFLFSYEEAETHAKEIKCEDGVLVCPNKEKWYRCKDYFEVEAKDGYLYHIFYSVRGFNT